MQGAIDKGVFSTVPSGKNPGPPKLNAVLTAAQQLASAMTYLHEAHNITHGDLTGDSLRSMCPGKTLTWRRPNRDCKTQCQS